jgi:ankyrin repeat protein
MDTLLNQYSDIDTEKYDLVAAATRFRNVQILQLLLKLRPSIDVNYKGRHGEAPLHIATEASFTEGLHILVDAGAKLDQRNNYLETLLHRAAGLGQEDRVRELPGAGASINVQDLGGETPCGVYEQICCCAAPYTGSVLGSRCVRSE